MKLYEIKLVLRTHNNIYSKQVFKDIEDKNVVFMIPALLLFLVSFFSDSAKSFRVLEVVS